MAGHDASGCAPGSPHWLGVAPADVTFVSNTTEGLNLAAQSLRFRPGDRIVLAADEFPSVARIWEAAASRRRRSGAVPIASEAAREDALLSALDARTRLLVVSQTHSSTGTTRRPRRAGPRTAASAARC